MKSVINILCIIALLLMLGCGNASDSVDNAGSTPIADAASADEGTMPDASQDQQQPVAESPSPSPTPEPNNGFAWNRKKSVWGIVPASKARGTDTVFRSLAAQLEGNAWTFTYKANTNTHGDQYALFEEAIDSKEIGAIVCTPFVAANLKTIAEEAAEAGIIVLYLDEEPLYPIGGFLACRKEIPGANAVEIVAEWVRMVHLEGSADIRKDKKGYPVAVQLPDSTDPNDRYCANAIRDGIEEDALLYLYEAIEYSGDDQAEEAAAWVDRILEENSKVHTFICSDPVWCAAVCDKIASYTENILPEIMDFCVVCCNTNADLQGKLDEAAGDPNASALRGYVSWGLSEQGGAQSVADQIFEKIVGITDGSRQWGAPYYYTVSAYASFGNTSPWKVWRSGDNNPAQKYRY